MLSHRLIPAALLCLFAFAAIAEEPTATKKATTFEEAMAEDGSEPSSTFQPVTPEQSVPEQPAAKEPASQPEQSAPVDKQTGSLEMAPLEEPAKEIRMPAGGMTMDKVEASFGTPQTKLPAVGEPPITRWVYRDYTVYFEHKLVVRSVRNDPRDSQ